MITHGLILGRNQSGKRMKFTKAHILSEIKRTAVANGGVALGKTRFEKETGIRETDWKGRFWIRWNDVVSEAGFATKDKTVAYDDDWLLERLVHFIRELGHYPISAEFRMKSRTSAGFPDEATFRKFGSKQERASKVLDYCKRHPGFDDVAALCLPVATVEAEDEEGVAPADAGYVYLMKSGKRYKIGKTETLEKRFTGLAAQVPHELIQVHAILTDDPSGIEAYWHNRFKAKRRHNEWFELSAEDVAAFKRRKFM